MGLSQKQSLPEPAEKAPHPVSLSSEPTQGRRSQRKSLPEKPDVAGENKQVSEKINRKSLATKEEEDHSELAKTGSQPAKTSSGLISQSPKILLRPSVLGDLGTAGGQSLKEGSFSAGASTTSSASSSLIVEGKRQWKPSLKMQQVTLFYLSRLLIYLKEMLILNFKVTC
jgi:hypothetical protein